MPKPLKYLKSAPVEDYYLGSSLISVLVEISKEQDGSLLSFNRDSREPSGSFLERKKSLIGGDRGEMVSSTFVNVDCQAYIYGLDSLIVEYIKLGDLQFVRLAATRTNYLHFSNGKRGHLVRSSEQYNVAGWHRVNPLLQGWRRI